MSKHVHVHVSDPLYLPLPLDLGLKRRLLCRVSQVNPADGNYSRIYTVRVFRGAQVTCSVFRFILTFPRRDTWQYTYEPHRRLFV